MPMFQAHIAISLGLIALVVGTAFLVWLKNQEASGFAKLVGYLTVLFSITGIVCIFYYATRYWNDGYYQAPFIITHDPKDMKMMHKMMGSSGMMNMMKDGMEGNAPATTSAPVSPQDHETHHQ